MEVASASINYYQTIWVVVLIRDAYALTSLETLMFPFSNKTWYLLAFIGLLAIIIVSLLRYIFRKSSGKNLDHLTMDLLATLVGMPAQYRPVLNGSRILKASWTIYSLLLRTVYQALLFHLIRTRVRRNMPETLDELVEQNYSLIVNDQIYEGLSTVSLFEPAKFINLNNTLDLMTLVYLESLPLQEARKAATALPLIRLQYYIEAFEKTEVFKLLPQSIMNVKLCMYFTKHSYLVEQFDEIMMMIKGYGLYKAWFSQEVDENYIRNAPAKANYILGFEELQMAFIMLLTGHILGILILIIEIMLRKLSEIRKKNLRQHLKTVKFIKKFY